MDQRHLANAIVPPRQQDPAEYVYFSIPYSSSPADVNAQTIFFNANKRAYSNSIHFTYKPLDKKRNEIRLLRILSSSVKPGVERQVACEIFHVPLNDPNRPQYEALSYVWGKGPYEDQILLAGKPPTVGRNLLYAL
jgi:hypothetical protein